MKQGFHSQVAKTQDQAAAGSWRRKTAAAVMAVAVTLPLLAQQSRIYRDGNSWVEEITGTLPAAREFRVNTDIGSVEMQGNSPRISYTIRKRSYAPSRKGAQRQFEQMRISTGKNADTDFIEGRLLSKNLAHFSTDFMIQVPRELGVVKVETRSGILSFDSISATIFGTTGGGSVKLDNLLGAVKIATGGGTVDGGNLGGDFSLTSGGGDVHINNIAGQAHLTMGGGRVYIGTARASTIQTGAGGIEVRKCDGDLQVSTEGGNLNFGDVNGALRADTGGGSVRLASAQGPVQVTTGGGSVELYNLSQGAQVETGAGSIMVEFLAGRGFAPSSLHTAAGDVSVCIPGNLPVTVHASSDMVTGHGIQSELSGLRITSSGEYGPKAMYAEGALNGGGPMLRVRTTIGQINFRHCH